MKTFSIFHKRHTLPTVAEYELLDRNLAFFHKPFSFKAEYQARSALCMSL